MLGKADWIARNLPVEGTKAQEPTTGKAMRSDVATCSPTERAGDVGSRVEGSRFPFAVVVADDRTVLGRLPRSAIAADPDAAAERAMRPGPSTVRPDTLAANLFERLSKRDLSFAIVTDPEGRLLGAVCRDDLGD